MLAAAIGEMELEMEDFVLSDSGAAGAFIHGLEDEFFEAGEPDDVWLNLSSYC